MLLGKMFNSVRTWPRCALTGNAALEQDLDISCRSTRVAILVLDEVQDHLFHTRVTHRFAGAV